MYVSAIRSTFFYETMFRVELMFSDHLCIVHHNIEGKDEDRFEHA